MARVTGDVPDHPLSSATTDRELARFVLTSDESPVFASGETFSAVADDTPTHVSLWADRPVRPWWRLLWRLVTFRPTTEPVMVASGILQGSTEPEQSGDTAPAPLGSRLNRRRLPPLPLEDDE